MSKLHSMMTDRLVLKTKKATSGCIEWQGRKTEGGYGSMETMGEKTTHRIAFKLFVSPIPEGLCVLHSCDNPPCVNPAHLFLGTHADNNKDRAKKGRSADTRGEGHPRAKLTEADVIAIRKAYRKRSRTGGSCRDLAKRYSVNLSTIHYIITRKNWSHIE